MTRAFLDYLGEKADSDLAYISTAVFIGKKHAILLFHGNSSHTRLGGDSKQFSRAVAGGVVHAVTNARHRYLEENHPRKNLDLTSKS